MLIQIYLCRQGREYWKIPRTPEKGSSWAPELGLCHDQFKLSFVFVFVFIAEQSPNPTNLLEQQAKNHAATILYIMFNALSGLSDIEYLFYLKGP